MAGSIRILLITLALLAIPNAVAAQKAAKPDDETKPRGSISGRVTKDGDAAAGAVVVLLSVSEYSSSDREALARVRTDQDGRYRIAGLAPLTYRVAPMLPAYVMTGETAGAGGTEVRVPDGQDVEGVDFAVVRGGVITGRVTDQDGSPISRLPITLYSINDQGEMRRIFFESLRATTDDRGVYRLYGLSTGKYVVSVGVDAKLWTTGVSGSKYYSQTYSPGVSDKSKARRVKVTLGGEETGVDIKVGPLSIAYSASGRIIDAESGAPIPDLRY